MADNTINAGQFPTVPFKLTDFLIKTLPDGTLEKNTLQEFLNQDNYKVIPLDFDFQNIPAGYENSIWEIRYVFNLGSLSITLPENITLKFKGGKFSNGEITGNNTKINSDLYQIFDTNITLTGFDVLNYFPEWFGAVGDGITDDTISIDKCMALGVVKLSVKAYLYTNTNNRINNATIIGEKKPSLNEAETKLENGSIIVGTFLLKGKNPNIYNLGVDHGLLRFPSTQGNALALAHENPFTSKSVAVVKDVVALCANTEDPFHAILIEGHYDTDISNILGVKSFFGCALKNTRNNVNNAIFKYNGSDNLIIKSDLTSGKVEKVNVTNLICIGSGTTSPETTSFSVRISAFDNDVEDVNISNIVTTGASYSVYLDASSANSGNMKRININGLTGSEMGRVVLMDGGSGTGNINKVNISNFNVDEIQFRPFEAKGNVSNISVNNFKASNILGALFLSSAFQITPDVIGMKLNSVELLEDNNPLSLGTVNLANSSDNNFISGNNLFNLGGVGIPKNGYTINSLTGATITVTPKYTSKNKSIVEMNASGTRTVTTITRAMPSGTNFPQNYELVVINNASGTLTIEHNLAGFIFNKGGLNVTIPPNEIASYILFGSYWREK